MGRSIRAAEIVEGDNLGSVDRARNSGLAAQRAFKAEMIAAYGGKCACCGETEPVFLSLEHVNGGGYQERKVGGAMGVWRRLRAEGWPKDGYRILCMNCQFGTKLGRTCPHKATP